MKDPTFRYQNPEYPSWQELTIVPVGKNGEFNLPKGEPDNYEVSFWFSTYSQGFCVPNNLNIDNPNPEPDSYLHIRIDTDDPKTSVAKLRLDLNNGVQALLNSNKAGRLSQIVLEIKAQDFRNAIDKSYPAVMPFLSHWSFVLNIPMIVVALKAKMKSTQSFRFLALIDGKTKMWPTGTNQQIIQFSKPESLALLSLYREAINMSISPSYQVFLLHRIREGVYKKLRTNQRDKNGEEVPHNCREVSKEFCGIKFRCIHNKIEQEFRNDFAHFNLTKSGLLKQTPDRFDNFYECITKWLQVSFYITRRMIEAELR